jgi:hypothetical protein
MPGPIPGIANDLDLNGVIGCLQAVVETRLSVGAALVFDAADLITQGAA